MFVRVCACVYVCAHVYLSVCVCVHVCMREHAVSVQMEVEQCLPPHPHKLSGPFCLGSPGRDGLRATGSGIHIATNLVRPKPVRSG